MDNATRECDPRPVTPPESKSTQAAVEAGANPDLTGRTLGEFRILRKLGGGGMGEVYLAEQTSLKREVALKVLRSDFVASHPAAMDRFQLEAQAIAKATHANIVQVYAIGAADGFSYMALEYVEGRNLKEYLLRKGPPEVLTSLSIMRQVAAALQRAGELGIIHRDVKPENILLTRTGVAKVADFGLSRCLTGAVSLNLTQSGVTMGTPLYMSPEQVEGKTLDPRSDMYSFGVTCYHMLAGHPPFNGESPFEVALKHVRQEPEPLAAVRPDLPEALCAVVHKMMAKAPEARYQTARDLLRDLVRLRESLSGQTVFGPAVNLFSDAPDASGEVATAGIPLVSPITEQPTGRRSQRTTAPTMPLPGGSRWAFRRGVLIGASVLVALTLGIAFGALRRHSAETVQTALPPEEPVADASKPGPPRPDGGTRPHPAGLGKKPLKPQDPPPLVEALQDGLHWLDKGDLKTAADHFHNLEKVEQVRQLHALGLLGLAVVNGLNGEARKSEDMLRKIAVLHRESKDCKAAVAAWKRLDTRGWLRKAVERNEAKGGWTPQLFRPPTP